MHPWAGKSKEQETIVLLCGYARVYGFKGSGDFAAGRGLAANING